ncbi:uncharacterized protein LOC143283381 isoform X2 [Babylonia areolata]|uniref:uncharacterized protein LOC143283381 isoform X2 n=1 Tax=Babylonia areolata TaxID=304850 RepID=UPI003FD0ACFD
MPMKGPPLCLLEGAGRNLPPDAKQGYPNCVVPAVRSGPPPCPEPRSSRGGGGGGGGALLLTTNTTTTTTTKAAESLKNGSSSGSQTPHPRTSTPHGSSAPPHGYYHQLVPQRSSSSSSSNNNCSNSSSNNSGGTRPHFPDLVRHHPVLGLQHPQPEDEFVYTRIVICCLWGLVVVAIILYLLYQYVREQTELQTPHVDVGHVEFINQVFAHRVADIIRSAASETSSSSSSSSSYSVWRLGWAGLGLTGAPLARVLGSGVQQIHDQGLWAREGQETSVVSSRGSGRRGMAVEDVEGGGGGDGGVGVMLDDERGVHAGRLKSSSLSSSSLALSPFGGGGVVGGGGGVVGVGGGAFRQVCELYPSQLVGNVSGDVDHEHKTLTLSQVRARHGGDLAPGGEWSPPDCLARYRLAVIIPYRDRLAHLTVLLAHLLPILKRQQLHFRIFVVEQFGNLTFNKGRIMNAAFKEALKMYDFQCVVFHDVDLIPEDDRNMYSCPVMPRHMSVAINEMNYKLLYNLLVGGVLNLRVEHYQQVNGYSNMYWGWGGEDDDMAYRILHEKLKIIRPPVNIARYQMIKHTKRTPTSWNIRSRLLRTAVKRYHLDGLNSVHYNIKFIHSDPLYTHIMVDIGRPDMRV